MKILFVYTEITEHRKPHYYRGLDSVMTVLKEDGHDVDLLIIDQKYKSDNFIDKVRESKYNLIAFTSNDFQWQFVRKYASLIKENVNITTLCGGIKPTFDPEDVINDPNIDIVCRGEGEYPLKELLANLESGKNIERIENLWIKTENKVIKNEIRPLINDLDSLPIPERALFDYQTILDKTGWVGTIAASRGCPHDCAFCSNLAWKKLYKNKGKNVRWHSPGYVIKEIKYMLNNYKFEHLHFEDEEFRRDIDWLKEFSRLYKRDIAVPFSIAITPANISDEILKLLSEAGCRYLGFGLETGEEEHRKLLNKGLTNDQIIDVVNRANDHGMKSVFSMMIGLPFDSRESLDKTIRFVSDLSPHFIHTFIYKPIKGTPLYDDYNHLINFKNNLSTTQDELNLNLPQINSEDLKNYFNKYQDTAVNVLLNSLNPGKFSLIQDNFDIIKNMNGIQINIDYWKYLLLLKPLLIHHDDKYLELKVDIKKFDKLESEIGFYRYDLNDGKGTIEYEMVFSGLKNHKLVRKIINFEEYKNIFNLYEEFNFDLKTLPEDDYFLKLRIIKKNVNDEVIAYWVNPILK